MVAPRIGRHFEGSLETEDLNESDVLVVLGSAQSELAPLLYPVCGKIGEIRDTKAARQPV